ncbi:hypothetical protein [Dysgonomonas termitidis]|uniref:Uncharacterized protein n=1 Tax=Dysgonomonas termitidis TaxID=1516126 RepID=A0ABV9KWJ8_9BACT
MKNLDLATLGVEEMNDAQMQEVDAGSWLSDFACADITFKLELIGAFMNGYNQNKR